MKKKGYCEFGIKAWGGFRCLDSYQLDNDQWYEYSIKVCMTKEGIRYRESVLRKKITQDEGRLYSLLLTYNLADHNTEARDPIGRGLSRLFLLGGDMKVTIVHEGIYANKII